jgi:hypothetical protein
MIEFDDKVIEIIRKQDRTISAANQKFFDALPAVEQRVFDAVSKHIQKFSSDGENFVFDDGNVLLTNQVEKIILDAIQASKYPSDVNGFLRNFDNIKQFNFDIHGNVNDLSAEELAKLIDPIQRGTVEQTLQSLTGSGVSTNFIEPLRTGIFQNIVAGATKADLEAYLSRYILGNPEVDGTLSRYVKQVSRDALNQFDGQVNAKIATEFGLDAYRYVGSLIEDSRPQCRRWVAMGVIQYKDLPSEIAWMNANGTGAIPGTSPDTFSIYRGGYNCRHSAIPFKLTKSQREKLNLEPAAVEPVKIEQQIKEVENAVAKTEQRTAKTTKQRTINSDIFLTTQGKKEIDAFNEIADNADDVIDALNKKGTFVTLRKPSECTGPGTKKFAEATGSKLRLPTYQIGTISANSGGNCATNNSYLNIKIAKTDKILFKKYEIESSEDWMNQHAQQYGYKIRESGQKKLLTRDVSRGYQIAGEFENGQFRPWTISTIATDIDKNIGPTITHELAHAIQNANDPNRSAIIGPLLREKGLKLSDAPTLYGQTNGQEFWTESFTAYVYANNWLKASHPKIFEFVEDYLKAMNIDINTVKIAK